MEWVSVGIDLFSLTRTNDCLGILLNSTAHLPDTVGIEIVIIIKGFNPLS